MSDTVDIPQVGPVQKKTLMLAVAGVGVIVAVAYYRSHNASSSAAASTDTTAAAGTIDPNAIDPQTGMTYADELATGASTYTNPNPGATGSGTYTDTGAITSDTQWAQAVENDGRMAQYGDLGVVLGLYLDRQPLNSDQATEVRAAWALYGHPPSNQPIIPTTSGSTTGGGGTTSGPPAAVHDLQFMSGTATRGSFALRWSPVAGATDYLVNVGPKTLTGAGSQHIQTSIPSVVVQGLSPNTQYYANVESHNAAGYGPGGNQLTNLKTLK